jgi:ubiquinone biosynthesis protein UbiJ
METPRLAGLPRWGAARSAALAANHVLRQQSWAAERLQPFAGRRMEFRWPALPAVRLAIRSDGLLETWDGGRAPRRRTDVEAPSPADAAFSAEPAAPDLTVSFRPAVVLYAARHDDEGRRALLREVDMTGSPELAAVIGELLCDLRWDAEEDLSRLVGDALAHRLADTGRKLMSWQQEASSRLARNVADYWTEENPRVLGRAEFEGFSAAVEQAGKTLEQLAERAARLHTRR